LRLNKERVSRGYALAGVTVFIAASLAVALGVNPASAAAVSTAPVSTASIPASNVHVGQVLGEIPRTGNHCTGKPAKPVHITVQGTAAHPNAYVNVAVNGKCQLVVSKIAYGLERGAAGGSSSGGTGAGSASAGAATPFAAATAVCSHKTHAVITELSSHLTVVQLTTYASYRQYCSGGNINLIAASASEVTYETTYGYGAGYFIGNIYVRIHSITTAAVVADAQDSVSYVSGFGGNTGGNIEAKDTTRSNGSILANCYWTSSFQAATGDSFGCSEGRDS
jgi:hypothetical protein